MWKRINNIFVLCWVIFNIVRWLLLILKNGYMYKKVNFFKEIGNVVGKDSFICKFEKKILKIWVVSVFSVGF